MAVDWSNPQPSARQQAQQRSRNVSYFGDITRPDPRVAIQEIQQREERAQAQPMIPSLAAIIGGGIGSAMRNLMVRQLEAGGTPVRENGMVIGVMKDGRYTGRPRQGDLGGGGDGDGASQAAQMGAGAPQPAQPAADTAGPATVRRSALAQQIEAENRRRRLAGMRRLGARTLLSGDRFTADTLGAG